MPAGGHVALTNSPSVSVSLHATTTTQSISPSGQNLPLSRLVRVRLNTLADRGQLGVSVGKLGNISGVRRHDIGSSVVPIPHGLAESDFHDTPDRISHHSLLCRRRRMDHSLSRHSCPLYCKHGVRIYPLDYTRHHSFWVRCLSSTRSNHKLPGCTMVQVGSSPENLEKTTRPPNCPAEGRPP